MNNHEPLPKEHGGIKLRLDWFFLKQLEFFQYDKDVHEQECTIYDKPTWNYDNCNCIPRTVPCVFGIIRVFRRNGPDDDKRYYQVGISNEVEDFIKYIREGLEDRKDREIKASDVCFLWLNPSSYPQFLLEDIENALETLYQSLKYYEATGEELDFFNVDAKELDKILYDKA